MSDYDVIYNANDLKPSGSDSKPDYDVIYNHPSEAMMNPSNNNQQNSLSDKLLNAGGVIGNDIGSGVANIWHGLGNLDESIPAWMHKGEAGEKYLHDNPLKALKELGVGALRATGQFADLPHKGLQYLSHLGLISPESSHHLMAEEAVEKQIPGIRKKWNMGVSPENEGAQFLSDFPSEAVATGVGLGAVPIVAKGLAGAAKAGIKSAVKFPQLVPGLSKTAKIAQANLSPLEKKITELKGGTNVNEPDLEAQMNQHLNENAEHRLAAGIGTNYKINSLKRTLGNNYNLIEKNLSEQNIPLQEPLSSDAQRELFKSLTEGKDLSKLSKEDIDKLSHMGEGKQMSALNVYQGVRDLKKKIRDERKIAYGHDVLQEHREASKNRIKHYENQINELEPKVRQVLSPEDQILLDKTNKLYRENIVPLEKSAIYRQLRTNKTLPKNIMDKLVGLSQDKQIIKNIIKSDPKILRNVVGEKYAGNLDKLHNLTATEQEYIQHMPELKQMIEKHKKLTNAKQELESAEAAKENAKTSLKQRMKTIGWIGTGALSVEGMHEGIKGLENLFSNREEEK